MNIFSCSRSSLTSSNSHLRRSQSKHRTTACWLRANTRRNKTSTASSRASSRAGTYCPVATTYRTSSAHCLPTESSPSQHLSDPHQTPARGSFPSQRQAPLNSRNLQPHLSPNSLENKLSQSSPPPKMILNPPSPFLSPLNETSMSLQSMFNDRIMNSIYFYSPLLANNDNDSK